jgi:hypothetical protein
MGVREAINKKRGLAAAFAAVVALAAVGFVAYQIKTSGPQTSANGYFSIDDGQTWFTDDSTKLPPFDRGGKQAVRVHLYKCGSGQTFVGYMDKYSDATKRQIEANRTNHIPSMDLMDAENMLVKKPGAANKWVSPHDPDFEKVRSVVCPDGSASAEPVE